MYVGWTAGVPANYWMKRPAGVAGSLAMPRLLFVLWSPGTTLMQYFPCLLVGAFTLPRDQSFPVLRFSAHASVDGCLALSRDELGKDEAFVQPHRTEVARTRPGICQNVCCSMGSRTRRRRKTSTRERREERLQTQAQGARSDAHPTTDTVSALSQALSSGMTMKQATPEATSRTGTYRMVQQSEPAVFDGVFKSGEDRQQRVMVFQAHMADFLGQEDWMW